MAIQQSLQVFETEDHQPFRTISREGDPWFVLVDVCRALDISNVSDASRRLDDDERGIGSVDTPSGIQKMVIVNESGLYSLILTSRKEGAKKFKKWVTSEVLPTIRKTGSYGGKVPAFLRRANENWDRVDPGYFSIIAEMAIRVWGRFEREGYIIADRGLDGKEIRPDISAGRTFSDWLKKHHASVANEFSYYIHKTGQWEGEAKQYPNGLLHLFIDFLETVWIPHHAERYLRPRDPKAIPFLPKVLASSSMPRAGMMTRPTLSRIGR